MEAYFYSKINIYIELTRIFIFYSFMLEFMFKTLFKTILL